MKILLVFLCFLSTLSWSQESIKFIDNQGEVTFFSYTSVENIEAKNNQVASIFVPQTSQIVVRILIRAFVFEKALMQEHFNESYMESDLFPNAIFQGTIIDFNADDTLQTKNIEGTFLMHGVTKAITFKAKILKVGDSYEISGTLDVSVKDYDIKIPSLLAPNIAEIISVNFNFQYEN